ncbi:MULTISPECIES: SAM-dependent methyltransferase [Streptomyces]|uniref:SAM-dependent methyltransferase n=1 Tax=Streptomyces lycii TaxID=2654337 RepID=A0ABQ7FLK2_9ACTN|nr:MULTISPECIES: SAM-dependent methyltransferase [Streptomyces]KAF4409503.1 SAM-dependent methyltransferase [Streptomyces lycii]PGH51968.1 SAM-dependent methyltransferase [Streptomyces sp. Ru87]
MAEDSATQSSQEPPEIDTSVPSIARVYDAILGGKDNYPVDQEIAEEVGRAFPDGGEGARTNRRLLVRAVRHLARQGIDQFLDIGSGLPTAQNTHEVAQEINPEVRVVYVDNDPIVLAHGRALLARNDRTVVVTADIREPQHLLNHPDVTGLLDFDRPVGLILNAVVHHLLDEEDPCGLVETYKKWMSPGSYLLLTHFCSSTPQARGLESVLRQALGRGQLRSMAEIAAFFEGLEMVEPGVVYLPYWMPDEPVEAPLDIAGLLVAGGLGRKPQD